MTAPATASLPPPSTPPTPPLAPPAQSDDPGFLRRLPRLGWAAAVAVAGFLIALLLIFSLSPEPLQPTDALRSAEALAAFVHKQVVVVQLLFLPIAALCTALIAPLIAPTFEPAPVPGAPAAGRRRWLRCRHWQTPALRTLAALTVAITGWLCLAVWDRSHPELTPAAWWGIYTRYAAILLLSNLAVAWLQFACERALHSLRRLRRWESPALHHPAGLPTVLALGACALCLSTTFISRPWILSRAPDDAMIADHLERYTAAIARQEGPAVVAQPTFRQEARLRVRARLRAALNAEAVGLTAELNPLIVTTALWWYYDDGPVARRVDLRTGAITYYQWVGSDSRITLPDFWAAAKPDSPSPDTAPATPPATAPTTDTTPAAEPQGPLAGIAIRTGFLGGLAGYNDWRLGPDAWNWRLQKEDAAPLAILLTLLTAAFALATHSAALALKL